MMRQEFGEPVKVLNASWGQSGSECQALRDAIEAAGESDSPGRRSLRSLALGL
jgi:hypothetical protein